MTVRTTKPTSEGRSCTTSPPGESVRRGVRRGPQSHEAAATVQDLSGIRTRLILAKPLKIVDVATLYGHSSAGARVRSSGNRTPQLAAGRKLAVLRSDWLGGKDSCRERRACEPIEA